LTHRASFITTTIYSGDSKNGIGNPLHTALAIFWGIGYIPDPNIIQIQERLA